MQDDTPLEDIMRQRDEYLEGWKRAKADFSNYRKEEAERLSRSRELVLWRVVQDFLPVLDALERAESHLPPLEKPDGLREGFEHVAKQIRDVFTAHGITEVEAVGAPFNPDIHEAVGERPQEGVSPGTVIDVAEKGYRYGKGLVRAAKVIVAA